MQGNVLDFLFSQYDQNATDNASQKNTNNTMSNSDSRKVTFFDIDKFAANLKNNSSKRNFDRYLFSENITAYDVAHNCIRQVLYRLYNTPIPYYNDIWLPVYMRQIIGNAVHEFIQDNFEFSEVEVAIKIDEFRFSGRIDAIINNNVLVEIKTVSFNDYRAIVNSNTPRDKDIKQVLIYKHLLENYLDKINETKNKLQDSDKYNWPKLDKYNIQYLQFIYIAHDLISSDVSSISEAIAIQRELKKKLNSKYNKFYFIKDIIIEVNNEHRKIEHQLFDKLMSIIDYYNKHILPEKSDYIDTKQCYFCMYKSICTIDGC